jgi:ribonuclease HI
MWIFDYLDRCGDLEATVLAVTCWHIWDARNKLREEHTMVSPTSVAAKIKAYVDIIVEHLFRTKPSHSREPSSLSCWVPPPIGMVLINVDAALFASSRRMGAGVVIRDHNGVCVAACSDSYQEVTIPELAEAMAMRRSLIFAKYESLDHVSLATDCLSMVQRINADEMDRSICGPVVQDIKHLIATFSTCSVVHVRRELNAAAHLLARFSEFSLSSVWRGVPPDCIRRTLCIYMNHIFIEKSE